MIDKDKEDILIYLNELRGKFGEHFDYNLYSALYDYIDKFEEEKLNNCILCKDNQICPIVIAVKEKYGANGIATIGEYGLGCKQYVEDEDE